MKSKLSLISSITQSVIGTLAIAVFIILLINGEDISKWLITLLSATAFVIVGITDCIKYNSNR